MELLVQVVLAVVEMAVQDLRRQQAALHLQVVEVAAAAITVFLMQATEALVS